MYLTVDITAPVNKSLQDYPSSFSNRKSLWSATSSTNQIYTENGLPWNLLFKLSTPELSFQHSYNASTGVNTYAMVKLAADNSVNGQLDLTQVGGLRLDYFGVGYDYK